MRISDWSSDVCSSDLLTGIGLASKNRARCNGIKRSLIARAVVASPAIAAAQRSLMARGATFAVTEILQIGRASCRERVCQYVEISVDAVSIQKKPKYNIR